MYMKKCLLLALAIMTILGCTSCEKEEVPTCPPPAESKVVDYTGAILPLTVRQRDPEVAARRELALDLSGWNQETGLVAVNDTYILGNPLEEPLESNLYYPIASSWAEWNPDTCQVFVDDFASEYTIHTARPDWNGSGSINLYYGRYDDDAFVGSSLTEYVGYCYDLERIFEKRPDLSGIKGYRYRITDVKYDSILPLPDDAAICIEYEWEYDPEQFQPTVGVYGFSRTSGSYNEDSSESCKFMVRVDEAEDALLFTTTKRIEEFTLKGYAKTEFDPKYELPLLAAQLTVDELPLSVIIEDIIDHYAANKLTVADTEQYRTEVLNRFAKDFLPQDGIHSYALMGSRLTLTPDTERIFWLEIPVTIKAGEEVKLSVQYEKMGGTELGGPAAKAGVRHYDILPFYGTNLTIQEQEIVLIGNSGVAVKEKELESKLSEGFSPDKEFYHFSLE